MTNLPAVQRRANHGGSHFIAVAKKVSDTFSAPEKGIRHLFSFLLLLYGSGHCSIIVAAGSAAGWVQRYLNWNEHRGTLTWLRRAGRGNTLIGNWYESEPVMKTSRVLTCLKTMYQPQ